MFLSKGIPKNSNFDVQLTFLLKSCAYVKQLIMETMETILYPYFQTYFWRLQINMEYHDKDHWTFGKLSIDNVNS